MRPWPTLALFPDDPGDLFDRGRAGVDLGDPVVEQAGRALPRRLGERGLGGAVVDQGLHAFVDLDHLIKADPPPMAVLAADGATHSPEDRVADGQAAAEQIAVVEAGLVWLAAGRT